MFTNAVKVKKIFSSALFFVFMVTPFANSFAAECSAEEKAKMVKLGMSVSDIKESCSPPEKESESSGSSVAGQPNITINVKQDQNQEQEQEQEQKLVNTADNNNGNFLFIHEPEHFFWNIGIGRRMYEPDLGDDTDTNKISVEFFSFVYFLDSIKEDSIGIGFDWLETFSGSFGNGNWTLNTRSLSLQYVIKSLSDFSLVPYVELTSSGEGYVHLDGSSNICEFTEFKSEDVSKQGLGIRIISNKAYNRGGGIYFDIAQETYKKSTFKGDCSYYDYNTDTYIDFR